MSSNAGGAKMSQVSVTPDMEENLLNYQNE